MHRLPHVISGLQGGCNSTSGIFFEQMLPWTIGLGAWIYWNQSVDLLSCSACTTGLCAWINQWLLHMLTSTSRGR